MPCQSDVASATLRDRSSRKKNLWPCLLTQQKPGFWQKPGFLNLQESDRFRWELPEAIASDKNKETQFFAKTGFLG